MKLGAQLYTVRTYIQNESDLGFTLEKIAKMGYQTVQISAVGAIAPEKIKKRCDENGLSIVLTHTDVNRILSDTEAVIEEHEMMNCPYIGIGIMPEKYQSEEWLPHFMEDFRKPAEKIAASGKLLMYHNHHIEFEKYHKKWVMDYLLEGFGENEMGITLDTYWIQAAGGDVLQWIEKLKKRIFCVHLKDMAVSNRNIVMAPVLEGNMNFPAILKKLEDSVCEYLLVEQDTCQGSPFACLHTSYQNLYQLGYR